MKLGQAITLTLSVDCFFLPPLVCVAIIFALPTRYLVITYKLAKLAAADPVKLAVVVLVCCLDT